LIEDLILAFSDVHQEKRARGVVLVGAGEHFCSGVDLATLGEISELPNAEAIVQWFEHWRRLTELFEVMMRFPKPVIAAVDGRAIGAGLGLAMACDIIVPTNRSHFASEAIRRGLVGGATAALVHFRLSGAIAARLLLAGETISSQELYRVGGCLEPVAPEMVWVKASECARRCSNGSPEAIAATKRVLNEGIGEHVLTQIAAGSASSATICSAESATEGIRAFLEKREPQWP
jgi:enoyl-CoA hydratase/carnithine racemase